MKEMIKYGLILALICIIASGLLACVNTLTKPLIIRQAQLEEEASLKAVFPQAETFQPIKKDETIIYYQALDKSGIRQGVVFKASGKGYSSTVEAMAGMLEDGTITAIKVVAQNETPGLGSKITEARFLEQFSNKKDLSGIQAISGATISSRAVINAVKEKAAEIRGLIKNE
jgi:electron transport complex protein RnfG